MNTCCKDAKDAKKDRTYSKQSFAFFASLRRMFLILSTQAEP